MLLDSTERCLIAAGLSQWGGPINPSEDQARRIGYSDGAAVLEAARVLRAKLEEQADMSRLDLDRALWLTEVAFVSDALGAGADWETVTGFSDSDSIRLIRGIQKKQYEKVD